MKTTNKTNGKASGRPPASSEAAITGMQSKARKRDRSGPRSILITGGAGFIGTNLAHHFLSAGQRVVILDNLSRAGVERNLAWLRRTHPELVRVEVADIRDMERVRKAVTGVSQVFHFAAQVAVTTSLENPFDDFEVNARGTLNLLEALRALPKPPPILFTSTNKVYGDLNVVPLRADPSRYQPEDERIRNSGFDETNQLDFHSPYGCSKGAAEQYVLDYARTFGLRAVVFRMSCIYGPHQFGTEDQGWVAHFLIRALEGKPISIYGDGKQVRDILFIDDLVRAMCLAHEQIDSVSGHAFNIGGGIDHTISLLELLDLIGELQDRDLSVCFDQWRPADQRYYVSDTRRFSMMTGWAPHVTVRDGVARLYQWLSGLERDLAVPVVLPAAAALRAPVHGFPMAKTITPLSDTLPSGGARTRSQRLWKNKPAEAPGEGTIIRLPRIALKS